MIFKRKTEKVKMKQSIFMRLLEATINSPHEGSKACSFYLLIRTDPVKDGVNCTASCQWH